VATYARVCTDQALAIRAAAEEPQGCGGVRQPRGTATSAHAAREDLEADPTRDDQRACRNPGAHGERQLPAGRGRKGAGEIPPIAVRHDRATIRDHPFDVND
jgi:hypothetical protein